MSINTNINNTLEDASLNDTLNLLGETINSRSISLSLENLTMQYSNLLIQYQQAVIDYNTYLEQHPPPPPPKPHKRNKAGHGFMKFLKGLQYINPAVAIAQAINKAESKGSNGQSSPNPARPFGSIDSYAYMGTDIIGQSVTDSSYNCMATCSQLDTCTGATYNIDTNVCMLASGQGHAVSASPNQIAIMPQQDILLANIENITTQLNFVNDQIQGVIVNGQQAYDTQEQQNVLESSVLMDNYHQLLEDREAISRELTAISGLNEAQEQGELAVSQNYYSFLLLIFLALIFIIILSKLTISGFQNNSSTSGISYYTSSNIEPGGILGAGAYYIVVGLILLIPLSYFLIPIIYSISQFNIKNFALKQENNTTSFFSNLMNKLKGQS